MGTRLAVSGAAVALAFAASVSCGAGGNAAGPPASPRIVDWGHALSENDPSWSGDKVFSMPLGVYHIENAANRTTLPAVGSTVIVAPIKIACGRGGPARVFAMISGS